MSATNPTADTAFRVAERLRVPTAWEVFAERTRRFEIHLNGPKVEMIRGPIALEGYGIRVLRSRDGKTGAGFQSSTDLTEAGVRAAAADAESVARNSEFPAKRVELPSGKGATSAASDILDGKLWDDPMGSLDSFSAELLRGFEGRKGVVPSFGSVRATLTETTITNSAGLKSAYAHTLVDFEVAVKAFGGPEGPAPGEYWVNDTSRRLEPARLPGWIDSWCRYAADVRRASMPPTGDLPVVLPASVLAGILPPVIGFRFTGAAQLRKIAPKIGDSAAHEKVTIVDDGLAPWAPASAPVDGEGGQRAGQPVIHAGRVAGLLYDAAHGAAFDMPSTASAARGASAGGFYDWRRFMYPPRVSSSTLAVHAGDGGTDTELIEAADDGIWVQQLGWAVPDGISGAFGGEIRIGYRIRHGKLAEPVRGGTMGGVVFAAPGSASLLQNIAAIGSKVELSDTVVSPTLLVKPLVVAGSGGAAEARATPSASKKKPPASGSVSSGTSGSAPRGRSRKTSR